ncbi:MAG: nucleoside permease [Phycisphaera sp.]|nr:nucleoside permease [Phycisphaera sp.]
MSQDTSPAATPASVRFKLSLMMFLQYAIWGAWLPILYPFLLGYRGFDLQETGLCLSAGALGAIFGPFLAGQLADRLFSTEKILAGSHFVGAILVYLLATVDGFVPFVALSAVYGFVYAPTLSLTNSISFANIVDRDRDFGPIRVWGTIGWIAAGILVGQYLLRTATPDLTDAGTYGVSSAQLAADPDRFLPILIERNRPIEESFAAGAANWAAEEKTEGLEPEKLVAAYMAVKIRKSLADEKDQVEKRIAEGGPPPTAEELEAGLAGAAQSVVQGGLQDRGRRFAFTMSSILGLVMAVFCLFLPHTPPTRFEAGTQRRLAWAEAFSEIRLQPLLTLFLIAIPVSMIHQFYFVYTSDFVTNIQNTTGSAGADQFAAAVNQVFGVGGGGLMTIGQMSEILVLALIPFFAKSLGRKRLLLIGLAAYALRMAIFAYSPTLVPVLFGVSLHGLCFGCFIFVAFMVVDEHTTPDVRATAQNLFNLVIVGIGIIVGSYFATAVVGQWAAIPEADGGGLDFRKLFSVPMWMAIASFLALLIAYPSRSTPTSAAAG